MFGQQVGGRSGRGIPAQMLNIVLGAWLIISAFAWPHSRVQMNNTWLFGALVVFFSALGSVAPRAHHLSALAAIWVFVSARELPSISAATVWNNILVAIAIFIVSLIPVGPTVAGDFHGGRGTPRAAGP